MNKERLREMEWLVQGHTAGNWQELESNLGVLPPKPILLISEHCSYYNGRESDTFESK